MSTGALLVQANALSIPLRDESVDLIVTSPPYFALRSYRDGGEHYAGQLGSEPSPQAFLEALWAVLAECWRVLKPSGSCFVNLGDKRSGSGGHNNQGISRHGMDASTLTGNGKPDLARRTAMREATKATRRNAPDRYNQASLGRPKSKMLLPHRFAIGCEDGSASPCGCPKLSGYGCPPGMHRADLTCVLHGRCRIPWVMRSDIVWQKLNGLPDPAADRCRDSHEYLFHFTKNERYFAAVDEVREPHTGHSGSDAKASRSSNGGNNHRALARDESLFNPLGKLPGSVWTFSSEPLTISGEVTEAYSLPDHFAAFPQELPRRAILGWSPSSICVACGEGRRPVTTQRSTESQRDSYAVASWTAGTGDLRGAVGGDLRERSRRTETTITGYACSCADPGPTRAAVILDPFAGTGTTVGVARALGRIGIGLDLSADYLRLARWRVERSGHFAKTVARTNRENQGSLL